MPEIPALMRRLKELDPDALETVKQEAEIKTTITHPFDWEPEEWLAEALLDAIHEAEEEAPDGE